MDIGERVRLRAPALGHQNIRGEVIDMRTENLSGVTRTDRRTLAQVQWDEMPNPVWYRAEDLVPLLP